MVDEDVAATDLREEVDRHAGAGADQAGMRHREPGVELQVGSVELHELLQIDEADQALGEIDLVVGHGQAAAQVLQHALRDRACDLDADDVSEPAPAHFQLDRLEQVVRLVRDLEVRVAGDTERAALDRFHFREKPPEEVPQHALERDEEAAATNREKARQQLRDLDSGKALLSGLGVADEDREAERKG